MVAKDVRYKAAQRGQVIVNLTLPKFLWEYAMSSHPESGSERIRTLLFNAFRNDTNRKLKAVCVSQAKEIQRLSAELNARGGV